MFWKLLGLQKLLDGLFDEGWCSLGLSGHEGFCHEEFSAFTQE